MLALALGALTMALASRLELQDQRTYDVESVPSSYAVRWLSLGHRTLAADLYWLRAVQYIGEPRADARGWDKLFPLVNLITDLDPRHGYAYQVAANVLSAAGRLPESNRILEKGMQNVPERYILPFHRAVNAMLYENDYALAGRYFEKAAAAPGAPPHLSEYVLATYVKGNEPDAAIAFLSHLLEASTDPVSRRSIEKQLAQARLEKAALEIDAAIEEYRERYLLRPFALDQLLTAGLLQAIPPDPAGGHWIINGEGRIESTVNVRRIGRPPSQDRRAQSVRMLRDQMRTVRPR